MTNKKKQKRTFRNKRNKKRFITKKNKNKNNNKKKGGNFFSSLFSSKKNTLKPEFCIGNAMNTQPCIEALKNKKFAQEAQQLFDKMKEQNRINSLQKYTNETKKPQEKPQELNPLIYKKINNVSLDDIKQKKLKPVSSYQNEEPQMKKYAMPSRPPPTPIQSNISNKSNNISSSVVSDLKQISENSSENSQKNNDDIMDDFENINDIDDINEIKLKKMPSRPPPTPNQRMNQGMNQRINDEPDDVVDDLKEFSKKKDGIVDDFDTIDDEDINNNIEDDEYSIKDNEIFESDDSLSNKICVKNMETGYYTLDENDSFDDTNTYFLLIYKNTKTPLFDMDNNLIYVNKENPTLYKIKEKLKNGTYKPRMNVYKVLFDENEENDVNKCVYNVHPKNKKYWFFGGKTRKQRKKNKKTKKCRM
jgi:hypothetical protein